MSASSKAMKRAWMFVLFVLFANCTAAVPETVRELKYALTFTCVENCSDAYTHTLIIDTIDGASGAMTGHGFVPNERDITWVMTGTLKNQRISMEWFLSANSVLHVIGDVDANGTPTAGTAYTNQSASMSWVGSALP